jgi:hypothetical protein
MKGSLHTDELMGAVVASPLRTARRMSHCFLMQTPAYPRPFIITDAALNIAPTLADKADIVRNAVDLAHAFGLARPRVAILAAVETINPHMPATLDAGALARWPTRSQIEGAILDGPLAFDNAVSAAAARTMGIVSDVAGSADILVVPDLESGNMLAKQLMYLGGAVSAGIVLGARVPIVLTSRADPRDARVASCAVALVSARRQLVAGRRASGRRRYLQGAKHDDRTRPPSDRMVGEESRRARPGDRQARTAMSGKDPRSRRCRTRPAQRRDSGRHGQSGCVRKAAQPARHAFPDSQRSVEQLCQVHTAAIERDVIERLKKVYGDAADRRSSG